MIYLCYGMTKSASTFLYQLTEEVFRVVGRKSLRLGPPLRPRFSVNNYFDRIDAQLLQDIAAAAEEWDVVLKTHGPPHPEIAARIARGEILASACMRDPREIALSMVDHGERSRRWRYAEFSECVSPTDAIASIDNQVESFRLWARIPGAQIFTYNEICFDTESAVRKLVAQIGVDVQIAEVMEPFRNVRRIGQFSKGAPLRYLEMPLPQQQLFLDRYAHFYEEFSFEEPKAFEAAARRDGAAFPRARGQLAQFLGHLRRLMR